MSVSVHIPTALRAYSGGDAKVACEGGTVGAALSSLVAQHPTLAHHLRQPDGKLRSFVNLYLNDEDVRYIGGEGAATKDGDVLTIVPSIAGGR
jgi:molybdopterin converting factor small subunit